MRNVRQSVLRHGLRGMRAVIPAWLQRLLEAKNPDGITRAVRATYCRGCGAHVMRGLDADVAALPTVVDPTPLDPLGEALALLANRPTYSLRWVGRYEIDHRLGATIAAHPAGSQPSVDVLAAHACNAASLTAHPRGHASRPPRAKELTDDPPF